jgi:hypothetical protein
MNISRLISLLGQQINESDVTDQELERQADIALRNKFKAPEKSDTKSKQQKADSKPSQKDQRPDAKKNPKQLRDKNSQQDNAEFEEDDNPLDIFQAQITSNLTGDTTDDEETEETTDQKSSVDQNTNIKEKPFNFDFCKNFDKFVKIVNSFRATESIRNDKVVKQYWEKLTLAEKQAVYIFFDNLTRVSDSEKDPDFKMPRTPAQLGVKISPAGQQNQPQSNQKTGQTTPQKVATPAKPVADITAKKAQNPIAVQPITVGESARRYISIDKLLQEVK